MLKIRLNKSGSAASGGGDAIPLPEENVTVTCPPHLVLADLPVARSIGKLGKAPIKIVGRKAQGGLGERVRFCVACDLPIAVYGRLIPCAHAFCLDCAKKDANCHLCDHRIEKIQTIKMKEKIFICGGPRCFKSFVEKSEFESHLHEFHSHLLPPNKEKVGDGPDAVNVAKPSPPNPDAKQSTPADSSTFQVPSKTVIPPNSLTHPNGLEGKSHQNIPRVEPPAGPPKPPTFYPQHQNYPPELQQENKPPPIFDGSGHYQSFHNQKSDRFPDKQLAISTESPLPDYPMHSRPLPNFMVPVNPGAGLAPTFNHPPLPVEGLQSFYKAPYEIVQQGMTPGGSEQSSVFSFPPVPSGGLGFVEGYPQPLNMGLAAMSLDQSNSQGRTPFVQADYTSFPGWVPLERPLMPSVAVKPLEPPQGGNIQYNMDGKAVLTPEPMPPISPPLPPLPPPHLMQLPQQGNYPHLGDTGREGQSYMWQNENPTGFRGDRN